MHIITRKRIQEFVAKYPDSEPSLDNWYRIVKRTEYNSFSELKQHFRSVDYVDGFVVFNISGNKYRLIAAIHFNRKKVYIRYILTHQEYDRGKWKRG
jgi:mRNA interferase HigB